MFYVHASVAWMTKVQHKALGTASLVAAISAKQVLIRTATQSNLSDYDTIPCGRN